MSPDRNEPFEDYTALLRVLIPQAVGAICYGSDATAFWEALPERAIELPESFEQGLRQTLDTPDIPSTEVHRLGGNQLRAYLLPIPGYQAGRNGALAVILDSAGELPWDFCAGALEPLTRILRRELGLRFRLVDNHRKLRVQAAEEKLLHAVESLVHQPEPEDDTLERILELCRSHLQIRSASLRIPDRDIDCSSVERGLREGADPADDVVLPVGSSHQTGPAMLVLSGWQNSAFSGRRRRRVGRYIASHIETIITRDYDQLTGLLAWPRFEAELEAACLSSVRHKHSLMYLDIDQLHVINENYGRETGDRVLTAFAELLHSTMSGHLSTRITSDSFAILLRETSIDDTEVLARQLCETFHQLSIDAVGRRFNPSVCIGVGPLSDDSKGAGGSLATAQVACRAAKDRGRGRVECYRPEDRSIVRRLDDIQLVGNVREAILDDRLTLMGQPIRSLKGETGSGYYEVLVRMLNDHGEPVAPKEFLSAAERYQLMEELDRWVVARSLRMLQEIGLNYPGSGVKLAINLSGQSLGSEPFLRFVEAQISEHDIAPRLLCFEITESVAVSNMQRAQSFMHSLKRLGCHFSLDDFGTGLSSFAYLKLFPVDTLKIDGSFIRDVASNRVSQSVVAAISEVARVMGLDTVAEFVQEDASVNLLRDLGITYGQGFHIGEPRPLEGTLHQLRQHLPAASRVGH